MNIWRGLNSSTIWHQKRMQYYCTKAHQQPHWLKASGCWFLHSTHQNLISVVLQISLLSRKNPCTHRRATVDNWIFKSWIKILIFNPAVWWSSIENLAEGMIRLILWFYHVADEILDTDLFFSLEIFKIQYILVQIHRNSLKICYYWRAILCVFVDCSMLTRIFKK